ncbi:MAG: GDP-mannose 4,6-dehydratase [Calditrichae bacterium]|nr:GDP-mannose 4,6-dehydratase [Calditrichia bacterium]
MRKNEKLFITGAAGFIGSHLTEYCCELGYDVKAFVRYNSRNSWGWLDESKYKNDIEVITGDIRDYDMLDKEMAGCTTVFHLAALIGIPYSYSSPLAYIKTNIEGTYNVLQAARTHNYENILITSTSETYGTAQYVPIDENHPAVGQSPYAATKISADQIALSFYRSFGMPVKIVRPFNTYGPRQSARAIIPNTIVQVLANDQDIQLGNLTPTRDLTFVKDTVKGFLAIAHADNIIGQATNIGMNEEISIGDLVKLILEIMQSDKKIVQKEDRLRPEKSEVERLMCNNSKLKENTSWKPDYTLRKGLEETIAWLKENVHLYKSGIYNI